MMVAIWKEDFQQMTQTLKYLILHAAAEGNRQSIQAEREALPQPEKDEPAILSQSR